MRKERLKILARLVIENHQNFNMHGWVREWVPLPLSHPLHHCGTTGCLAALAVAEFHPHVWEDYQDAFQSLRMNGEMVPDNGHIREAARELLGLTTAQTQKLFYVGNWPDRYRLAYSSADSTILRANITSQYLLSLTK